MNTTETISTETEAPEQFDLFGQQPDIRGMHRTGDHQTSIAAAKTVKRKLSELHNRLIEAFKRVGPMTDGELELLPEFSDYGPSTIRKRRSELYQRGCLEKTSVRKSMGRSPMVVWKLTGQGDQTQDAFDQFIHTEGGRMFAHDFIKRACAMWKGQPTASCEGLVSDLGLTFTEPHWYRRMVEFTESRAPQLKGFLLTMAVKS